MDNVFLFSLKNFMIRYGIIELILIFTSIYIYPIVLSIFLFLFVVHLFKCASQVITVDPFQIVTSFKINDRNPTAELVTKTEKYFYFNEINNYKVNYIFITIYGDIDFRKKHNVNGSYEEQNKKINKVKIYRGIKNEEKLIKIINEKIK